MQAFLFENFFSTYATKVILIDRTAQLLNDTLDFRGPTRNWMDEVVTSLHNEVLSENIQRSVLPWIH